MRKQPLPTEPPKERAFLVGIELKNEPGLLTVDQSLAELSLLAETAGLDIVGMASQKLNKPDPKTFIRSGKVTEVRDLAEDMAADVIIFDEELSPRHQRELERALTSNLRVVDRTALILDIFAQHAKTREGSLQVELAQYEYLLPRLTRAWTHLARQAGGGGGRAGSMGGVGLRGPGETQLEVDRRDIRRRISYLNQEIEKVRAHRSRHRTRRRDVSLPTVALVGYTNAGKSTLLNALSGADVYVADELFATLDPTTRRIQLPHGGQALITDTVGFIQKLPTTLIAAFRATLEEIAEADLLLHVVDLTHPNAREQADAVRNTLDEIGVGELPVITALNKIDATDLAVEEYQNVDEFDRAVPISALRRIGLDELLAVIEHELFEEMATIHAVLPYREGRLISMFYEHGNIIKIEHNTDHVSIRGRIPARLAGEFQPYTTGINSEGESEDLLAH